MRIPAAAMPAVRLSVVLIFTIVCGLVFGYLWLGAGGRLPLLSEDGYRVSVSIPSVDNLVTGSDVTAAGVEVGQVVLIDANGKQPRVTMQIDHDHAPLHRGAKVIVRYKTLLQESFLEVADGPKIAGAEIAGGSALPQGSAKPSVDLDDVLSSIDQPTRKTLAKMVRSLGAGTEDTGEDIAATVRGLGDMGRQGKTALAALSRQSGDLRRLTGNTATLLSALDTQQGQIANLVDNADKITEVTANGSDDIQAVMRKLPALLDAARNAGSGLKRLSRNLGPVAANLDAAAPDLSAALRQLPATARDLRGLLPALDGVLDQAPATLRRVPVVSSDARELMPNVRVALGDVNPMLAYLQPYGRDLAAWFASTADAAAGLAGGGNAKFTVTPNEQSAKGLPGGTEKVIPRRNPYPGPGQAENPAPFGGEYPRVGEGEN